MKKIIVKLTIAALPLIGGVAQAGQFNAAVGNVFAFCEAPRPCNKCPLHSEWDQLCPNNKADGQRAVAEMQKQGQALLPQGYSQQVQQPANTGNSNNRNIISN